MEDTRLLNRMMRAAEAWGRRITGQPVMVTSYSEPSRGENGVYTSEVQIQTATTDGNREARRLRCLVTLEPDGALGCIATDDFAA